MVKQWKEMLLVLCCICLWTGATQLPCPHKCNCSASVARCRDVGLKTIDESLLPPSIRYLDLSNNPGIKFKKRFLRKFKQLQSLNLNNCSLREPFFLPTSIAIIKLSNNQLSLDSVKTLLSNGNWKHLIELDLTSNKLPLDKTVFSLMPKGLHSLNLGFNIVSKIARSYLAGFKSLRKLNLNSCGLTGIEAGAFDSLVNVRILNLNGNQLQTLPLALFRFNKMLHQLFLRNNLLTSPPDLRGIRNLMALSLGRNYIQSVTSKQLLIKCISALGLGTNKIKSFNLNATRFHTLDLSRNRITRIEDFAFSGRKVIRHLFLHDNRINYISSRAFDGISNIMEFFLQRNRLEQLTKGTFRGISIEKLFLFENSLTNIEGLLDGMKSPPRLLLLFGNQMLRHLNGADYKTMRNDSVIYIGCSQLIGIEGSTEMKAKVICSPTNELEITTPTGALHGDGFKCQKKSDFMYHCKPCPAGHREVCQEEYCGGTCTACPAGAFYQDEMAAISCKNCPKGQYVPFDKAPGKSPLECLTCPQGTNTNSSAGYRACPCLDGYARTYRFGECQKCKKKGFQCKQDYPVLQRGYWMSWGNMKTASNKSCKSSFESFLKNLDTKNDTYDKQTTSFECQMPNPHKCPIKGSCLGGVNSDCKQGYTGVLCAVCDSNFMKNFNKCTKCPSPAIAVVQCIAYILAFVFICWIISITDRIKLAEVKEDRQQSKSNDADERTFADVILSSLKILMGFYQVLNGMLHALAYIHWPKTLKTTMGLFRYVQLEVIRMPSLHCIKAEWRLNAVSEFWFSLIATAAVPSVTFIYLAIKSAVVYCSSFSIHEFKRKQKECYKRCLRATALFLFATYPLTSSTIVKVLPPSCHKICTTVVNGTCILQFSYLRSDYSIECLSASGNMNNTLIAAYVALLLPLGLPFGLYLLLWRFARHHDHRPSEAELHSINDINASPYDEDSYINASLIDPSGERDEGAVNFALKFAYENYDASCWYWEVLEMVRKLIMTVGIALFLQHTKIGLGAIIIIAMMFTIAHATTNPLKDKFENFLQLISLSIIPTNLAVGAILHSKGVGDKSIIKENEDSWALGILLVILNSLVIVLVICRLVRAIIRKIASRRVEGKQNSCFKRFLGCICACPQASPISNQLNAIGSDGPL